MTSKDRILSNLLPWAGLIGAGLGWAVAHQAGSDGNFFDCNRTGAPVILLITLVGVAVALGGGLLSLRVWRARDGETAARAFIALVSMMSVLLFLFAIILPLLASLINPRCFK